MTRGLRGGAWGFDEIFLRASDRTQFVPADEGSITGFRVAIVPEPSVAGLMGLGIIVLAWKRK